VADTLQDLDHRPVNGEPELEREPWMRVSRAL
jgi:hypothetical protein